MQFPRWVMLIECISKLFSTTPLIVIFCRGDILNLSGFFDFYVVKWRNPYLSGRFGGGSTPPGSWWWKHV